MTMALFAAGGEGAAAGEGSALATRGAASVATKRSAAVTTRATRASSSGRQGQRVSDAATGAGLGNLIHAGPRAADRAYRQATAKPTQRLLVAEFVVCLVILALSPMVKDQSPKDWMRRGTAMCGVFMVLGMVGAIGPRTAKAMSAFGALVAIALLVDSRELFGVIAKKLGGPASPSSAAGPDNDPAAGAGPVDAPPAASEPLQRAPFPGGIR